jgi:hypothetical protein
VNLVSINTGKSVVTYVFSIPKSDTPYSEIKDERYSEFMEMVDNSTYSTGDTEDTDDTEDIEATSEN